MAQINLLADSTPVNLGILRGFGVIGGEEGKSNLSNLDDAATVFVRILSTIIGVMTVIAIIWFVFVLITGAIGLLASGGDKVKVQNAQKQITTGFIGLLIVLSALFLLKISGALFGFGFDITDVFNFILKLGQ